jgi:hypothetical protein
MDDINVKYVSQLLNTHKVVGILMPLMEAVEINRRSGGIEDLNIDDLMKHVIGTGSEIYQRLLDKVDDVVEPGLVADKLFLSLAMTLRNGIVLYNNPSLELMKDDLLGLFETNMDFIQRYQNDAEKALNKGELTEAEKKNAKQEALGFAVSSLSQMFMPVWIFHTNLYTSGLINEDKMAYLNREAGNVLVEMMGLILKRMEVSHGKYNDMFKISSVKTCGELFAYTLNDYHNKLVKNKTALDAYIDDPVKMISKLTPAIHASFTALNQHASTVLAEIIQGR